MQDVTFKFASFKQKSMARPRLSNEAKLDDLSDCIMTIEENLQKNSGVSTKEIISLSPYKRKKMNRIFKATLNETASEYLTRLRLELAKKLLAYTDTSIGDIAELHCYNDFSTFEKAFREKYNQTPSSYRNSVRAEIKKYEEYSGEYKYVVMASKKVMFLRENGDYNGEKPENT